MSQESNPEQGTKTVKFKEVSVSSGVTVSVPDNLTPEEEANFIASRIGFVDLEQLTADLRKCITDLEEGKMIPLDDVLEELARDDSNNGAGQ